MPACCWNRKQRQASALEAAVNEPCDRFCGRVCRAGRVLRTLVSLPAPPRMRLGLGIVLNGTARSSSRP